MAVTPGAGAAPGLVTKDQRRLVVRVSLEVAIGFVVQLAVGHQLLHAGEGLGAVQGRAAEELAWQGRGGGQRSAVGWPRVSLGTLPAPHHLL